MTDDQKAGCIVAGVVIVVAIVVFIIRLLAPAGGAIGL